MTTKVRFLDLAIKDLEERKAISASVEQVLIHGMVIQGPEVEQLERKIAVSKSTLFACPSESN